MPSHDRRRFLSCAALCAGMVPLHSSLALAQGEAGAEAERLLAERELRALRDEARGRALYGKKLVERLGSGVLAAIGEVTRDFGRGFGRNVKVAQRDLDGLIEVWKSFPPVIAYAVDEHSPTLLRFRVTRCLYAEEMRKHEAVDLGFAYYCTGDYGFGETYSPEITFERTKTLMQGHDCCNQTYRLAKT
jgi:hypothetical protein